MAHAAPLLERYRNTHLVFNDDIQGTATCAVGGVYGAMAVQGAPCALHWLFMLVGSKYMLLDLLLQCVADGSPFFSHSWLLNVADF